MAKPGPLSIAEKEYIENHCDNRDIKSIAKELDRSMTSVEEYANNFRMMRTKAGGQFGRNRRGSVVMTENASTMGDVSKKKTRSPYRKDCVVPIKKNG